MLVCKCPVDLQPQPRTRRPQKSGGLHTGMYSFLEREQCLVWNVFKDKANFAGRVDRMGGHRFGEHAEAPCIGMSPRTSLPLPRSDCAPLGKSASYFCVWKREQRPFSGSCRPFSDPKETLQCRCAMEITQ